MKINKLKISKKVKHTTFCTYKKIPAQYPDDHKHFNKGKWANGQAVVACDLWYRFHFRTSLSY